MGNSSRGFSLMELVVVIAILAIVAAVAMPRGFNTAPFSERSFAVEAAAAARHSRAVAVASGCAVEFRLAAGGFSARQQLASGGHCNAGSSTWSIPVTQGDGTPLLQSVPTGVTVPRAVRWVFQPDGTATAGGGATARIGRFRLTLDAASGYVSPP